MNQYLWGVDMFNKRYRIVTDNHNGFEAQVRYWFFPVWLEAGGTISFSTSDGAEEYIEKLKFKSKVVKYID